MRPYVRWGAALALGLSVCACSGTGDAPSAPPRDDRLEAAYRANNRGVLLLDQFAPEEAATVFREALELDSRVALATLNLPIALFYAGDLDGAAEQAERAGQAYPQAPQAPFVLGLVRRARNELEPSAAAFQRVLDLDPGDVGATVNLAIVRVQQRRYDEALALCDAALEVEPYNATAAYNRALALTRSGRTTEGERAMQVFDRLRSAPFAVTYTQTYSQQGRYAEALASTGMEAGSIDVSLPSIAFIEATPAWLGSRARADVDAGRAPPATGATVSLVDLNGDGRLDLVAAGRGVRLFVRGDQEFEERPAGALGAVSDPVSGIVGGDLDNDGRIDLVLLTAQGPRVFLQDADGRFSERRNPALNARRQAVRSALLVDADHDGDLDLLFAGAASTAASPSPGSAASTGNRLLRNRGDATFDDLTERAEVGQVPGVHVLSATDFDHRRDVDIVMAGSGVRPALLRNGRDGRFVDVAASVGLPATGPYAGLALGDVNQDGFADMFLTRDRAPGTWAISDGRGRFVAREAGAMTAGMHLALIADFDNDGLNDLVVARHEIRLLRNVGTGWTEVEQAFGSNREVGAGASEEVSSLVAGDVDSDGDLDLVVGLTSGAVRLLRNDGGSRLGSLSVRLTGRVSNKAGIGARVEVRAGSLYQAQEVVASTPATTPSEVLLGLGRRDRADLVRALWPSGVLQTEAPPSTGRAVTLLELDRAPSSCPFLFTWNGTTFTFVTDFLGGGEMGYWSSPGHAGPPDPEEYVRIGGEQLQPRDGALELRVTNELEEVLFADAFRLLALEHDDDEDVYPNEGMTAASRSIRWYRTGHATPLANAVDEHGHDVSDQLSVVDGRAPDDFERLRVRGYARDHAITMDLPPAPEASTRRVLLLTGWTDYAFSSDNVAANQAGWHLRPPSLQVPVGRGWQTVVSDVGIPVGRPQTIVVELPQPTPAVVRLVGSMQIYWDRIAVADVKGSTATPQVVPLRSADLRWRGFSAAQALSRGTPLSYDYHRVARELPWKLMPGDYTRTGNVTSLVSEADDRLVVAMSGDELALVFDATRLPPLARGRRRTFVLHATGYSKEMDLHSASPYEVGPLPFRSMTTYPYAFPERHPHGDEMAQYASRRVLREVPLLIPPSQP
ncbi:MAG: FG-GAP-like repeat-containing protein [Vicinamibacterales bacterium]